MKIGVLGTGMVAQIHAGKLASLGHTVMIGTRDVSATMARDKPDMMGNPPFAVWREKNPKVDVGTFAQAAAHGEIVIAALNGQGALPALRLAGADNLAGKVMIDITNPLDFSKGMPPSLFVSNTDSLGEQIQRELPRTKVVKTLNIVNAYVMVDPGQLKGGDLTMFVSGNDAGAKAEVTRLLGEWYGWKDVIDLGDITTARGTEMLLPIWVRIYSAIKNPMFGFKVVR